MDWIRLQAIISQSGDWRQRRLKLPRSEYANYAPHITQDGFGQFKDARVRGRGGVAYQAIDASRGLLHSFENDSISSMLIRSNSTAGFIDYAISKCSGSLDPPAEIRVSE